MYKFNTFHQLQIIIQITTITYNFLDFTSYKLVPDVSSVMSFRSSYQSHTHNPALSLTTQRLVDNRPPKAQQVCGVVGSAVHAPPPRVV